MSELIDNSKARVELLKEIIKELHAGEDPQAVKRKLSALVQVTTSEEIVAMEQQLIAEGMSIAEIKGMCDLHAQVTQDLMLEPAHAPMTPGHPVHTFRLENTAVAAITAQMRGLLEGLTDADLPRWRALHEQLLEVEKHYARKENVLFPHLERHGVLGPSKVMWAKDDDIRVLLRALREALAQEATIEEWRIVAEQIAAPLLDQIEGMITKEESILFPLALGKLTPAEWSEIFTDSQRFGFCLVEPGILYTPQSGGETTSTAASGSVRVGVGSLTLPQLTALFETLPVDLTLVDADDRVAFFSEGRKRIFDRSHAIIGRKVQMCHPPHSVDVVERILADFRRGARDLAEFWIELRGRFVHIQYFALRGEGGAYLGTLEVTQDATQVRALTGERRLLQYEEASK